MYRSPSCADLSVLLPVLASVGVVHPTAKVILLLRQPPVSQQEQEQPRTIPGTVKFVLTAVAEAMAHRDGENKEQDTEEEQAAQGVVSQLWTSLVSKNFFQHHVLFNFLKLKPVRSFSLLKAKKEEDRKPKKKRTVHFADPVYHFAEQRSPAGAVGLLAC